MQTRKMLVLVVVVVVLTVASLFVWKLNTQSFITPDNCTTDPKMNLQVWLQKVAISKATTADEHSVVTVSQNPDTHFEIADITRLSQKLSELNFWQTTSVFSTKNLTYVTPQNLCIILVSQVQEAGQVVSSTDENKVLQSYSSEFDYATNTYKLYLHFDPTFYKEKVQDRIGFGYVISYALMERLFDSTTPEEKRVTNDLAVRRAGKKEFLEPFTAKQNMNNPSLVNVTKVGWSEL